VTLIVTSPRGNPSEMLELPTLSQGPQLLLVSDQAEGAGGVLPLVSTLALDGSVNPPNQVVLAAGHAPGMYLVARYINRRLNPTAGSITTAVLWSDLAPFSASLTQSLISSGSLLNPGLIPCFSDGTAALQVSIAFTGMVGLCNVDVRSWAIRQQSP